MTPGLRPAPPGDESEVRLVEETAFLGISGKVRPLFRPASADSAGADWERWLEREFAPQMGPHFARVHQLASAFQLREIRDLDRALDASLSPAARERSLAASAAFLDSKEGMRHHPEWKRVEDWIDAGKTPGHFPTLAALQAALFHLPLGPALLAVLRFEFRRGMSTLDRGEALADDRELFEKGLPFVKTFLEEHSRFPGARGEGGEPGQESALRAV